MRGCQKIGAKSRSETLFEVREVWGKFLSGHYSGLRATSAATGLREPIPSR
jgi:hypothetical protein